MIKIIYRTWYLFLVPLLLQYSSVSAENKLISSVSPSLIYEALVLNRSLPTRALPKYRSPAALALSRDGRFIYVAEQTAKRVSVVDIKLKKVCRSITVPNEVTGLAVAPDGKLYVSCSSDQWPEGMVCEISPVSGKVLRRLPAGFGARSPVISLDGTKLYLCNQYGNDVQCIDIEHGTVEMKLHGFHQPFSASITPEGSVLVVVDCLPSGDATDHENVAARVYLVNTREKCIDTVISLPMGSHSVFDVTVTPDGAFALVTHLVGLFTLQASEIEGGWIHTNNLAVIDIRNRKLLNDFALDDPHLGAANPWEVSCTDDGTRVGVAQAGTNELTIIDMRKMIKIAGEKSTVVTFENDIEFTGCTHDFQALSSIKERVPIAGRGPRAVVFSGRRVYTAGYFGDSTGGDYIEMFDCAPGIKGTKRAGKISLGLPQPLTGARKGEQAFYDATLCHQRWQSCASCHPAARADGLNWILGKDPTNTFKNAKSLVNSWWTSPTQWSGKRANAGISVRLGFVNSFFAEINYPVSADIDTFLMQIQPVRSPFLFKGKLSPAAEAGKRTYFKNSSCDCIKCHNGPLFTDKRLHSSSIPLRWDALPEWDTPPLIETWRDKPYGHLGTFDRIEDIMRYEGHSESKANGLSEEEFRNLVQYILSL
jgi:DNA-binding beta-propeller fold protein YncE